MVVMCGNAALSWYAKPQSVVATSTAEAEYIAASAGVKMALSVKKLLIDVDGEAPQVSIMCDNQSAIHLMKQPTAGIAGKTKHIDLCFHFCKDRIERGDVFVEYVQSGEQRADMFTKALGGPELKRACIAIGCIECPHNP
jgi:hypothetical protein